MLIFDIEIANPIAPKNPAERQDGLFYARDFNDYENMGIACIGVYEYTTDKYRVFGEYELDEFRQLLDTNDVSVGYNNTRFDNNVLKANKIDVQPNKSYDIYFEIVRQLGHVKGCKLDDVIKANFPNSPGKNGDGAQAPILWQPGYHTKVIDYCLNDVRLTKMLMDRIIRFGWIKNPIFPDKTLKIKRP